MSSVREHDVLNAGTSQLQQSACGQWQRVHHEIEAFAHSCTPSSRALQAVEKAVESVRREAASIWPASRTYLFGSQASGLSLPSSDLDLVILNAGPAVTSAALGFSSEAKLQVTARLKKLLKRLRVAKVVGAGMVIGRARVPIIKASTCNGHYSLDISMGTINGAAAVSLLRHQINAVPPLRPLALLIRALLKAHGLNEVYTGGLSSYSITWAILAHLQQEGFCIADPASSAGMLPQDTLPAYHALPSVSYQPDLDLGALLHGFFRRFGEHFDAQQEAVSILQGGFIRKPEDWQNEQKSWLMAVEDPQDPGRDIAAGSFEVAKAFRVFADAASNLAAANDSMNDIMQVPSMAEDLQRFPILSCILDVEQALSVSQPVQNARAPAQSAPPGSRKRSHSHFAAEQHYQHGPVPPKWSGRKQPPAKKLKKAPASAQKQPTQGQGAKHKKALKKLAAAHAPMHAHPQAGSARRERDEAFGDTGLSVAPAYHGGYGPGADQPAAHRTSNNKTSAQQMRKRQASEGQHAQLSAGAKRRQRAKKSAVMRNAA